MTTATTTISHADILDALRRRIDAAKGFEFELLAENYLRERFGATDIWPQDPDLGVDRFFTTGDGRKYAVQMKAYKPSHNVSMRDMTQFVEAADAEGDVDALILLTTSDDVSRHARGVIHRHDIEVHTFKDLIEVECWEPASITLPDPLEPRDYQAAAIAAAISPGRLGQIIMPTGSGKSLVQAEIAKHYDNVLVMVPSVELVRQIAGDFRRQEPHRNVLAVVSSADKDDHGIPVEHTTKAAEIESFLHGVERPLIIATYASSQAVINGAKGFRFDMAMYDEAHRTAGASPVRGYPLWKRTLADVHSTQRRFFTATPRIHDQELKDAAKAGGVLSFSMDDEDVYGPRLFEISISDMIERGYLSPFDIVASVVTKKAVLEQIERNGWTDEYNPDDLHAIGDLAAVVFTLKAAADLGMTRVLTFHNRVEKAQRAAELFERVGADLGLAVKTKHVSAESGKRERHLAVRMLKEENPSTINIVCNVNLFGEGVNTPALDAIVYFDAKSSPISIVQSIGRALRPHETKDQAYVLVPVYVDDADDAEKAVEASRFGKIYKLGSALRDMGITPEQIETVQTSDEFRVITKRAEAAFSMTVPVPEGWDVELFEAAVRQIILTGSFKDPADLAMDHFTEEQFLEWMDRFANPIFNEGVANEEDEKDIVEKMKKSVFDFVAELGIEI